MAINYFPVHGRFWTFDTKYLKGYVLTLPLRDRFDSDGNDTNNGVTDRLRTAPAPAVQDYVTPVAYDSFYCVSKATP